MRIVDFVEISMHYIIIISFAFLCSAVPEILSIDSGDDDTLYPFVSPDDASAGDLIYSEDLAENFPEDFPYLQPETSNILFDPAFDEYGEGLDSLPTTYMLDGCSVYSDQQIGRRIRAREAPALCPIEPKTSSDQQPNSDGNSDGNGSGDDDFIYKNDDGVQTEPKNSLGLNRYGTNSDGTICPPNMWLLCSASQPDLEGSCLGCYPCECLGFSFTSFSLKGEKMAANSASRSLHIYVGLGILSASEAGSLLRGLQLYSECRYECYDDLT